MSRRHGLTRKQIGVLVLAVVGSGAAGVAAVGLADDPRPDARAVPSDSVPLAEGTAAVRSPSQPDPRGGPPWSTVEFRTEDGRWCAKPGRLVDGSVGNVDYKGRLVGASLKEGGDCVDVARLTTDAPVAWHVSVEEHNPRTGAREPVSFVWGLARPGVAQVRVVSGALVRFASVSSGRAFIAVLPGRITENVVTLDAILQGGEAKRIVTLQRPSGTGNHRDLVTHPPTPEELEAAAKHGHQREGTP